MASPGRNAGLLFCLSLSRVSFVFPSPSRAPHLRHVKPFPRHHGILQTLEKQLQGRRKRTTVMVMRFSLHLPPPRPSPRRGGKKHTSGNFSTQYSPEIHPYFTLFLCVILFCFKVASLPFLVLRSPPPLMLSVKKKTSSGNYSPCYSPGVVATQGYIRLQCLS